MLVLVQILRCGSGRQKEALKRLHWIHGLMAERDDSGGCIVAKHLGNPIDLLILRFWQTREAMERRTNAYYQDRWPLFPSNEPEGIYQTQDITHHWEEVMRTDGDAKGGFIWRSTFRVPRDRWPEFMKLRETDDAVMRKSGGLVHSRTFRSTENDEEALSLVRLKDRTSLDQIVVGPEHAAIETNLREVAAMLEYPELNIFGSECFEIVDEYGEAAQSQ
jgi:hypothetical protein